MLTASQRPENEPLEDKMTRSDARTLLDRVDDCHWVPHQRKSLAEAFSIYHADQPLPALKQLLKIIESMLAHNIDCMPEISLYARAADPQSTVNDTFDFPAKPGNRQIMLLQEALLKANVPIEVEKVRLLCLNSTTKSTRRCCLSYLLARNSVYAILTLCIDPQIRQLLTKSELQNIAAHIAGNRSKYSSLLAQIDPPIPLQNQATNETLLRMINQRNWQQLAESIHSVDSACTVVRALNKVVAATTVENFTGLYGAYTAAARHLTDEKYLMVISNSLINLGARAKPHPVAVKMWSSAIELEARTKTMSPYFIEKLRRLILAIDMAPEADFQHIKTGIAMLIADWSPSSRKCPSKWEELAASIARLKNTDIVVDMALDLANGPEFLMTVIKLTPCQFLFKSRLDEIMGHIDSPNISHHTIYYRSLGKCWSSSQLMEMATPEAFYLLALTETDLLKKHSFCEKALANGSDGESLARLIWTEGFCFNLPSTHSVAFAGTVDASYEDPDCESIASAERLARDGRIDESLVSYKRLLNSISAGKYGACHAMDILVRLSQLHSSVGNASDTKACLQSALNISRAKATHPVRSCAYALMLKPYQDENLTEEENKVLSLGLELTKFYEQGVERTRQDLSVYRQAHQQALRKLGTDPIYAVLPDVVLSVPAISASANADSPGAQASRKLQPLRDLTNKLSNLSVNKLSWKDRQQRADILGSSITLLEGAARSGSGSKSVDPCLDIEASKKSFIHSTRAYYQQSHIPSLDRSAGTVYDSIPIGVIAVALNIDANGNLTVARIQAQSTPLVFTLPTSRVQSLSDTTDSELTIPQGIAQLMAIIKTSETPAEVIEGDKAAARLWWESQKDKEAKFSSLISRMEKCWLGGFRGLLDPYDRQDTEYFDELASCLENTIAKHIPRLSSHQGHSSAPKVVLEKGVVNLFASLGYGADAESEMEACLEDLLFFVLDNLRLRGYPIEYDEIDLDQLVIDAQTCVQNYKVNQDAEAEVVDRQHLVLIPDSQCHQVPWESFPCLESVPATRALSLKMLVEMSKSKFYCHQKALGDKVFYVVNPAQDLSSTQTTYETQFKLRRWTGVAGAAPPESQIVDALKTSSCYIYVGHGSGKAYIRGSSIKSISASGTECCPVMLLGCGSAKLQDGGIYHDTYGALTDFGVAKCPLFVGNLWNVKDKDFNRLCIEFLGRVFDDGEDVCQALMESRKACVLRHLTGAAPVIYGLSTTL